MEDTPTVAAAGLGGWAAAPPAGMAPVLVVSKEGREVERHELGGRAVTLLGRQASLVHVPQEHASLSRQHAALAFDGAGGHVYLGDPRSSHGTALNGRPLPPLTRHALAPGDVFTLGGSSRTLAVKWNPIVAPADGAVVPPSLPQPSTDVEERERERARQAAELAEAIASMSRPVVYKPPPVAPVAPVAAALPPPAQAVAPPGAGGSSATMGAPPARAPGRGGRMMLEVKFKAGAHAGEVVGAPPPPAPPPPPSAGGDGGSSDSGGSGEDDAPAGGGDEDAAMAALGLPANFNAASAARRGQAAAAAAALAALAPRAGAAVTDGTPATAAAVAAATMAAAKRARVGDDVVAVAMGRPSEDRDHDDDDDSDSDSGTDGDGAPANAEEVAVALKLPLSHEVALAGHKKTVTALAVDASGVRVVTGAADYTVRLYDFSTMDTGYKPYRELVPADGQPVQAVDWAPGGDRFVVATTAAKLHVFRADGSRVRTTALGDMYRAEVADTRGHIAAVTYAGWHPVDANYVVSSSLDGTVRLWDVAHGPLLYDELQCTTVIRVKSARGGKTGITSAAMTRTGRAVVGGTSEGALVMYDIKGAGARYLRPDATVQAAHAPGDAAVTAIVLAPDGSRLATRGTDGLVRLWDLRKFSAPVATIAHLPTLHQTANVAWSPDGALLVAGVDGGRGGGGGASGGAGVAPPSGGLAPGRLLAFQVSAVEAAEAAGTPGGIPAASAAAYAAALCDAPVVRLAWHGGINQIAAACGDGATRVLYNPALSAKGAMLAAKRLPKKRDLSDTISVSSAGIIVAPLALPRGGGAAGRKRRLADLVAADKPGAAATAAAAAAAAAALPLRAAPPTTAVEPDFLTDKKLTFTQHFVQTHLVPETVNLREQDPAEVLRAYAAKAAADPEGMAMRAAYATTAPTTLLASRTLEEEEAAARSELDAFLHRNVAGR